MTAERDKLQQHLEARQELDQMLMAGISAPAADGTGPIARVQGPRAQGHRIPREARWLKVVPGVVLAALIGLKTALRHAWIAHPAATAATGAGTFSAVALMTAVTVVPGAVARDHSPAAAGIPGWHTTASPIPVPSTGPSIAAFVNRAHLPGLDVRTGVDSNPDLAPPPYYYAPPVSSQPSSSSQQAPPSQQSAQSGPAVLQVPLVGIDLSSGTPQQIQLSATGSGWVSWKVSTAGTDLDFSPSSGVLQAGQSATLTVSLDASQDGNPTQVFTVGGQQITATLPAPAPVVVPTDAVPTDAPTDVPSPSSS